MNEGAGTVEKIRGPLVFLADIHGNLPALEAVVGALGEEGAGSSLYVAGDLVFGGEQPLAVWKRLQDLHARCVRGTSDLALATLDPARLRPRTDEEHRAAERFHHTREALGELVLARLARLPEALRLELPDGHEIVVVHGSPADAATPITVDLDDDEIGALIGDDPADVVVCGAGHVPFERTVGEVRVVSPGSVGEAPEGRVAHFALGWPTLEGLEIRLRWVPY